MRGGGGRSPSGLGLLAAAVLIPDGAGSAVSAGVSEVLHNQVFMTGYFSWLFAQLLKVSRRDGRRRSSLLSFPNGLLYTPPPTPLLTRAFAARSPPRGGKSRGRLRHLPIDRVAYDAMGRCPRTFSRQGCGELRPWCALLAASSPPSTSPARRALAIPALIPPHTRPGAPLREAASTKAALGVTLLSACAGLPLTDATTTAAAARVHNAGRRGGNAIVAFVAVHGHHHSGGGAARAVVGTVPGVPWLLAHRHVRRRWCAPPRGQAGGGARVPNSPSSPYHIHTHAKISFRRVRTGTRISHSCTT